MKIQPQFRPDKGPGIHRRTGLLWIVTRVIGLICIFVLFGCLGGGCPFAPAGGGSGTGTTRGIHIESIAGEYATAFVTHGETVIIPVSVEPLGGEIPGETVVVTPSSVDPAVTFYPASISVTLPEFDSKTYISFVATVNPGTEAGYRTFFATRTRGVGANGTDPRDIKAEKSFKVVPNLVSVEITPVDSTIQQGQSRDFTLSILPRGLTQGDVTLKTHFYTRTDKIDRTPSEFDVTLVQGSTTPVLRTITLAAHEDARLGPDQIWVDLADGFEVSSCDFRVLPAGGGDPTFEISATPLEVTTPTNVLSAQSVQFTVSSVNGFSGPVKITYVVDGYAAVSPSDNNFEVNVTPTTPATFSKRFYLYGTGGQVPITFNATDIPYTTTKGVTINVKVP